MERMVEWFESDPRREDGWLEIKLYEMGYERIFSKLQDGVKSLLQGCKFAGLKNDLVDELEGINYFPRENVYVTATQKVSVKKQCGYFSMKKGMVIKQKYVSPDGQIGFGWTRLFKGGPKRYGFYYISGIKQNT
ncbi:hypothetical protein ACF0H5_018900 [Mactra antiquata]